MTGVLRGCVSPPPFLRAETAMPVSRRGRSRAESSESSSDDEGDGGVDGGEAGGESGGGRTRSRRTLILML